MQENENDNTFTFQNSLNVISEHRCYQRMTICMDYGSVMTWTRSGSRILALQPHARLLQFYLAMVQVPAEVLIASTDSIHITRAAVAEVRRPPEPSAVVCGAVITVLTVRPRVIITIIGREHHPVVGPERVEPRVTGVAGHCDPVVVLLALYDERAVLGVDPVIVSAFLEVEPQLVSAGLGQLGQQVVTEPVVAIAVAETNFKLGPRTVEEVRPVHVLLDQQRNAVL